MKVGKREKALFSANKAFLSDNKKAAVVVVVGVAGGVRGSSSSGGVVAELAVSSPSWEDGEYGEGQKYGWRGWFKEHQQPDRESRSSEVEGVECRCRSMYIEDNN